MQQSPARALELGAGSELGAGLGADACSRGHMGEGVPWGPCLAIFSCIWPRRRGPTEDL